MNEVSYNYMLFEQPMRVNVLHWARIYRKNAPEFVCIDWPGSQSYLHGRVIFSSVEVQL